MCKDCKQRAQMMMALPDTSVEHLGLISVLPNRVLLVVTLDGAAGPEVHELPEMLKKASEEFMSRMQAEAAELFDVTAAQVLDEFLATPERPAFVDDGTNPEFTAFLKVLEAAGIIEEYKREAKGEAK